MPPRSRALTTSADSGGIRWRTRPQALGVVAQELQTVGLPQPLPQGLDDGAEPVDARAPVAGRALHAAEVLADPDPVVGESWCPSRRSRGSPPAAARRRAGPAARRVATPHGGGGPARRAGWVRERTTSTMVRPVPTSRTSGGPAWSRRTTSSAPGAHGSGTRNAESRSACGAQPTPASRSPVARTTASARQHLPVVEAHPQRLALAAQPGGRAPGGGAGRAARHR